MSAFENLQVTVRGELNVHRLDILSPEAVAFVRDLARFVGPRVETLLQARDARTAQAKPLDFFPETKEIREGTWTCNELPECILDRRVEITGPVDRKMIINALNSGSSVFMADFEDANSPTWENCIDGQFNLRDAVHGTIAIETAGKSYKLGEKTAVLFVRPRGWHLTESHFEVDGKPVAGALFDFGLYFFHNAKKLIENGRGPFFYLPKMEHYEEARLWNDIFVWAQEKLGIARGTIKATCLVETLPAAFQMNEFLYELREHSAGLNCGRWDYIFSFIKSNAEDASKVMPDRALVTMTQPCMQAYARLVIQTCHKRKVHAMGGMAAQIPVKHDEAANAAAFEKVRADKLREVEDGHDGTWVAHPALVAVAKEVFDERMKAKNQIDSGKQKDLQVSAADILRTPEGIRSENGLRTNVRVGIQYIEAWLRGSGAVPLYNLMEDAATAEISRTQVWQWMRHGAVLQWNDGSTATLDLPRFTQVVQSEMETIEDEIGTERLQNGRFAEAKELFVKLCTETKLSTFLTLPAYQLL